MVNPKRPLAYPRRRPSMRGLAPHSTRGAPVNIAKHGGSRGDNPEKKIPALGWKTHTVMMIHNDRIEDNDVNETGYEGLSSGSDGVLGQAPLGQQLAVENGTMQ